MHDSSLHSCDADILGGAPVSLELPLRSDHKRASPSAPETRACAHTGAIELILGPMFSEKTTEMVSRVRRAALAGKPALIVKYRGDTRYTEEESIATHSDVRQATTPATDACARIRVVTAETLAEVELLPEESAIGVDEGQFYSDLVDRCERWANEGRRVIVAALDGDFLRRPFGQVCDLVPLCESVEKRRGVCMTCRTNDSVFTRRIGSSKEIKVIGARDKYRAVCRRCYFEGTRA